jgi:putative DNA primase/helicase
MSIDFDRQGSAWRADAPPGADTTSTAKPNGRRANGRASGDADGAPIGTPEIDVVEARRFLQLLHADHEDFIFAAGDDNAERVERLRRDAQAASKPPPKTFMQRAGTLEQLLPWLNKKQAEGWGIFVTVQSMRGSKRRKDELDCIRATFHESDIPGPLPSFKIEPSLIVETSLHPDAITGELSPKRHCYWLIDAEHPMRPESFNSVMACMVETYASDPDAKDLARVLRLPGSWHLKGEPQRVRIVSGTFAQHRAEELIAKFPRPPEPAKAAKSGRPKPSPLKTNGGLERFIKPLGYISPYERATWRDVGMALHHESHGDADGFNMWCDWAQGAPDKYDPADSQRVWDSFTTGRGITGGTIFSLAEQSGYAPEKRTRANANGAGNGSAPPPPPRDPPGGAPSGDEPQDPGGEPTPGSDTSPDAARAFCIANEDAIAEAFAGRYAAELRYCHDSGAWFRWDSSRWKRERRKLAFHYARHLARTANIKEERGPAKASTAAGVEKFAQADPRLATESEQWDRDIWLLATPGGTVDLRTGDLRPAKREDLITRQTAVAPAPVGTATPMWSAFLEEATRGDQELIAYLQRVAGYCLTGDVSEQALFFIYGAGGNGKGVFINTLTGVFGDYVTVSSMDTFTASRSNRHETDLAMLRGARLVTAQETEEGRAWNEVRIKAVTGGDPISARFMRQDYFTFKPTFKLIIAGNHKPSLRSVDDANRRRFNIIPFTNKPAAVDKQLFEKLKAEWPGILRWCIEGGLQRQAQSLKPPPVVRDATETYFDEQDLFTQWVEECCDVGPHKSDTKASLFASWKAYCERNGDNPGGSKAFTQALKRAGYEPMKNTPGQHGKRGFKGITVRPTDTSTQWHNKQDR